MFCAFEGPPKIVRPHGRSEVLLPDSPEFQTVASLFPAYLGHRAIIHALLTRISDSCGYGVPRYESAGDRDMLMRRSASKGPEGLRQYRREKNARSLDDLLGLTVASD